MKKTVAILILSLSMGSALADNLFQSNNPFPQTTPQTMNNIYESEPATIQQEAKQQKKSWFRKGRNLQAQEATEKARELQKYPEVHEGTNNGSFYVFK